MPEESEGIAYASTPAASGKTTADRAVEKAHDDRGVVVDAQVRLLRMLGRLVAEQIRDRTQQTETSDASQRKDRNVDGYEADRAH